MRCNSIQDLLVLLPGGMGAGEVKVNDGRNLIFAHPQTRNTVQAQDIGEMGQISLARLG